MGKILLDGEVIYMKNNGCYNCTERHLGCHTDCIIYGEYKSYLEKIKKRKQAERLKFACHKGSKVYGR